MRKTCRVSLPALPLNPPTDTASLLADRYSRQNGPCTQPPDHSRHCDVTKPWQRVARRLLPTSHTLYRPPEAELGSPSNSVLREPLDVAIVLTAASCRCWRRRRSKTEAPRLLLGLRRRSSRRRSLPY
jgi:hypothetical protein